MGKRDVVVTESLEKVRSYFEEYGIPTESLTCDDVNKVCIPAVLWEKLTNAVAQEILDIEINFSGDTVTLVMPKEQ